MRNRVALVFLVGMLAGALMFAGGFFVATSMSDDAEAQATTEVDPRFWQTTSFDPPFWNEGFMPADPNRNFDDWLHELPAACDVQTIDGSSGILVYYRCPEN